MRQTHKSLKDQVLIIRKAVSDMFVQKDESILLDKILLYGGEVEQNYILSKFDRYGVYTEYEKSGIRVTDKGIKVFLFGYEDEQSLKKEYREDSLQYVLAKQHIGEVKEREMIQSFITYPKMDILISAFKVVNCMHNFKVPLEDAIIYDKIRKIKHIISKIRERGLRDKETKELADIMAGENFWTMNKVLSCFDSVGPSMFKGIRIDPSEDGIKFKSISKNNIKTEYRFGLLTLPATKAVFEKWKEG